MSPALSHRFDVSGLQDRKRSFAGHRTLTPVDVSDENPEGSLPQSLSNGNGLTEHRGFKHSWFSSSVAPLCESITDSGPERTPGR